MNKEISMEVSIDALLAVPITANYTYELKDYQYEITKHKPRIKDARLNRWGEYAKENSV